eukprot:COSAG03_NODE_1603_length_3801_cov_82.441923_1_plen_174_part_00
MVITGGHLTAARPPPELPGYLYTAHGHALVAISQCRAPAGVGPSHMPQRMEVEMLIERVPSDWPTLNGTSTYSANKSLLSCHSLPVILVEHDIDVLQSDRFTFSGNNDGSVRWSGLAWGLPLSSTQGFPTETHGGFFGLVSEIASEDSLVFGYRAHANASLHAVRVSAPSCVL